MTIPALLQGHLGDMAIRSPVPPPYLPKPSILDRILGRLIPTDQYGGLLDPTQQKSLQRQGLLQLGTGMLAQPGSALGAFGKAYQGLDIPGMADHALKLQAYRTQIGEKQAVAAAKAKPRTGTPYEQLQALVTDLAGMAGTEPITGPLSSILDALKQNPRSGATHVVPLNDGIYLVRDDGTKIRVGPAPGKPPKEPTPAERVAGSQYESADSSIKAMRDIANRNPEAVKQAIAAIKASRWGKLGQLYTESRGTLNSQDAQDFFTHYSNMLLTVTPTYGGARPTVQLMDLEKAATLPAIGSGDFKAAFQHMDNRLRDLRAKAGKAMTPSPPPAAGEYDDLLK